MNKNIILRSDGTGNGAAKRHKTNVWCLYDTLDLHQDDQVAFYDNGVGSQEFFTIPTYWRSLRLGPEKKHSRTLQVSLHRNYKADDKIYLFGFSRSAFTVRMLAGMIDYCGVYTDYLDEQHLDQVTRDNYNAFRSHFKTRLLIHGLRTFTGKTKPVHTQHTSDIEFIGVWDTVDA